MNSDAINPLFCGIYNMEKGCSCKKMKDHNQIICWAGIVFIAALIFFFALRAPTIEDAREIPIGDVYVSAVSLFIDEKFIKTEIFIEDFNNKRRYPDINKLMFDDALMLDTGKNYTIDLIFNDIQLAEYDNGMIFQGYENMHRIFYIPTAEEQKNESIETIYCTISI